MSDENKIEDGDAEAVNLPTAAELDKAFKEYFLATADKNEAVGTIGALVKKNEDQHNIHRKAFKLVAQLEKMDDTKRSEFLVHALHYMAVRDLGVHPDLFEDDRAKELAAATISDADRALLESAELETVQ